MAPSTTRLVGRFAWLVSASVLLPSAAWAQDKTWDNGLGNGLWSAATGNNWATNGNPAANQTAQFAGATTNADCTIPGGESMVVESMTDNTYTGHFTIDGTLARKTGTTSDWGRLLDPLADKLLLVTVFVAVSIPGLGFEPLPWWLAAMAIGRDLAMLVAAGVIYLVTGFSGFTPTQLGKLNTFLELVVLGVFLGTRAFGLPEAPLTACIYLTAASIAASGIHYVFHVRRLLARRLTADA